MSNLGLLANIQQMIGRLNPPLPPERRLSKDARLSLFIHWTFTLGASMSGVFLNLYLWRLTESLAINGTYQVIVNALTPLAFAWAGSWVKKKDRMFVFRLGVIFSALFYLLVVVAQERVADYFYVFAVLNGLANSFYWTGYLVLMFDVSTQENRLRYMSTNTIVFTFANLIGPALAGFIISRFVELTGYVIIFTFACCMFCFTAIVSLRLKPIKSHHKRYYLRFMGLLIRKNRAFRNALLGFLLYGTFQGIIMFLPNILLFEVFAREDLVGYLGVGFSLIAILAGFLISRYGKDGQIRGYVLLAAIGFTAASLFLLMGLSVRM